MAATAPTIAFVVIVFIAITTLEPVAQ